MSSRGLAATLAASLTGVASMLLLTGGWPYGLLFYGLAGAILRRLWTSA